MAKVTDKNISHKVPVKQVWVRLTHEQIDALKNDYGSTGFALRALVIDYLRKRTRGESHI